MAQIFYGSEKYGSGVFKDKKVFNPHKPPSHAELAFSFLRETVKGVRWNESKRAEFCKAHNVSQNTLLYFKETSRCTFGD